MHDQIKDPVAHYYPPENRRPPLRATPEPVAPCDQKPPPNDGSKTVRKGIVCEVDHRHTGNPRRNDDLFDPHQKQGCPEKIDELGGQKEGTERNTGAGSLGCKAQSEMAKKHDV
jgi:hypothetical protein